MKKCLKLGLEKAITGLSQESANSVSTSAKLGVGVESIGCSIDSTGLSLPADGACSKPKARSSNQDLPAAVREKLKLLSFVSILVVLFNHSATFSLVYNGVEMKQPSPVAEFLLHLWQGSFGRVNRLLFFSISGFLFFWTLKPELNGFVDKWRKRIRSLAVPYLIWSAAGLIGFMVLFHLDSTRQLMGRRIGIGSSDWPSLLRILVWDPIPYQFWYIRDLLALILASPVIYVAARVFGWWLGFGAIAAWVFGWLPTWPEENGITFFILGAVVATRGIVPQWNLRPWLVPCLCIWTVSCLLNTATAVQGAPVPAIIKLGSLFGLVTVWALIDFARGQFRKLLLQAAAFTFFVFAAHEPMLSTLRKAFFKVMPFDGFYSMVAFVIIPLATLAACLVAGWLLRRFSPGLFGVLMGGRGQGKSEG